MDQVISNELIKNAAMLLAKENNLSPSYQTAMKNAQSKFEKLGLPNKSDEDWKYTNIAKNIAPRFFENKESIVHDLPSNILDRRGMIIFNNGVFNKFQSVLPPGIELHSPLLEDHFFDSFDSLNFGVATAPFSLKIKKKLELDFPITIIHQIDDLAVNKIVSPRLTIIAEEFTKAHFVEIFTCVGNEKLQYTTNAVTHFTLLTGSSIEHVKIQKEASTAVHVGLTSSTVNENASFKSMTLDFGAFTSRHNLNINLNASGANTTVHGLLSLKDNQHADVFSVITHSMPHTTSDQLFKCILDGEAHGVFTGKVIIKQDAQKSSSAQLNKNLLLSKKAHIDTRPQLLVHADDVKCSHGATIGQLSKEEEFYLESRGISPLHAKKMLCHGFAMDVLLKIEDKAIRNYAEKLLLNGGGV